MLFKKIRPYIGAFLLQASAFAAFDAKHYKPPVQVIQIDATKVAQQFYVSPSGRDQNDGSQLKTAKGRGPFASLERARQAASNIIQNEKLKEGAIVIHIDDGDYYLENGLKFSPKDSGTQQNPIVFSAINKGRARLFGGKIIEKSMWSSPKDPSVLKRIDPSATGNVLQLDLSAAGFHHTGPFPDVFSDGGGIFELFCNEKRMPLSRWPDEGRTTMQEVTINGDKNEPGTFIYREDRPTRWLEAPDIWLKGQWRVGWEDPAMKVGRIDADQHSITFAQGLYMGIGNKYTRPKGNGQEPWYAINLLEEITQPGEWCIDFKSQILYFWPPEHLDKINLIVSQTSSPLIEAQGLKYVSFTGLSLEYGLGDGMSLMNTDHVLVAGCRFYNLGGKGITLDGDNSGIQSCDMSELGQGCIVISGGDRNTLRESGNYVINNHLHHYGVRKAQYSAAVDLYYESKNRSAVGMLIAHNTIHHAPRDAFLVAGNKVVFEYNDIYRCGYDTADTGAFYSWMDWTIRGVVIRYNYIHDTVGGVNPDDGASGFTVYGNVFKGDRTGVWIASGPGHIIKNNLFIKSSGPAFGLDDRGDSRKYATNKRLLEGVENIQAQASPWKDEFPEMIELLKNRPELPVGTKFVDNIIWRSTSQDPITLNKISGKNKNVTGLLEDSGNFSCTENPGFENPEKLLYKLNSESPAKKALPNFPDLDMSKAGIQIDNYRSKLPSDKEAGRLEEQNPYNKNDQSRDFGT